MKRTKVVRRDDRKTKKSKKTKPVSDNGCFDSLPEDIILSILTRVADLRFLCQSKLVSKLFASTISRIQSISITLPGREDSAESYRLMWQQIGGGRTNHGGTTTPPLIETFPHHVDNCLLSLENFRELRSIYIEFKRGNSTGNSSLLKWKAKCGNRQNMLDYFVALLPASITVNGEENQEDRMDFSESRMDDCCYLSVGPCLEWLFILYMIIHRHKSVESITITNSEKQGKLVVEGGQLVELRNSLFTYDPTGTQVPHIMKFAWVPMLKLPLSGYVMNGVNMLVLKFPREQSSTGGEEDDETMVLAFEEDEKVFGEAVKEILSKHKDKILSSSRNQLPLA